MILLYIICIFLSQKYTNEAILPFYNDINQMRKKDQHMHLLIEKWLPSDLYDCKGRMS